MKNIEEILFGKAHTNFSLFFFIIDFTCVNFNWF